MLEDNANPNREASDLTKSERAQIAEAVRAALAAKPPTIGLIGVSGTGKSSTINTMFGQQLAVSPTVRCTTQFSSTCVKAVGRIQGSEEPVTATLRVFDAPGLGEDFRKDEEYLAMYRRHLPECDVILWVMTARNRAVALDQQYLRELSDFHERMVFGINQVDLVEPCNWNSRLNAPSPEQAANMAVILADRKERMEAVLKRPVRMVMYGAKERFELITLLSNLIDACPSERAWMFDQIKKVSAADFLDLLQPQHRRQVLEAYEKQGGPAKEPLTRHMSKGSWQAGLDKLISNLGGFKIDKE